MLAILSSHREDSDRLGILFLSFQWFTFSGKICRAENILPKEGSSLINFSSVQFSHSVVSNSLWPHGLKHARPPCPSPTPRVYSNSCPLSWWCHQTILSSVIPFSSRLQSFPASGSFQMSQFCASGGRSIGVSGSTSVLTMSIQDWFPLGWTGWILLAVQGTLKSLFQHHSSKASILQCSAFFIVQLSHPYMTTGTSPNFKWPGR